MSTFNLLTFYIDQELAQRRAPTDASYYSPGGGTFLREMTSSWKCDVKAKIRLRRSMRIYLKNSSAKFHPDPIWNDGAGGFFGRGGPNKNKNKKMSSDYELSSRW